MLNYNIHVGRCGRCLDLTPATALFLFASITAVGCTPSDDELGALETGQQPFTTSNGIVIANGLNLANGIKLGNGIKLANGINFANGINLSNGIDLSSGAVLDSETIPYFAAEDDNDLDRWIDADPEMHERILKYLVECALPPGQEVRLKQDGTTRTLAYGVAGLGPSIQNGLMASDQQHKVSACILARVNAQGEVVDISTF